MLPWAQLHQLPYLYPQLTPMRTIHTQLCAPVPLVYAPLLGPSHRFFKVTIQLYRLGLLLQMVTQSFRLPQLLAKSRHRTRG